jgi:hypothetical protein
VRAADQVHALRAYLSKRPTARESAHESAHPDLGLVVVIPCHDEPDPLTTLESLWRCLRPRCAVEILLVVNASESDDVQLHARNQATVDTAYAWRARFDEPRFRFHVLNFPALPARHAGVGLARKIGMDAALARFVTIGNARGIIASLDADCTCDHDYLISLESHFEAHPGTRACSIYFEHDIDGPLATELYSAVTHYELFLRYYRHGLRYAAFPHDCYTVGSCMAVRCDAYARHGGMNRRKAGEDFYFLNKLMAVGGVTENNATRVVPGVRASTRTPFGTGRALHDRLTNLHRPWLTYDPRVFCELTELVAGIDDYYGMPPGAWRGQASLSPCMGNFLIEHGIVAKHAEILANCASPESFRKRFFQWFDAFRALKFIHFATDHAYPRQPLEHACTTLLKWQGLLAPSGVPPSAADMLLLLRRQDRGQSVVLDSHQVPVRLSPG